MYRKISTIIWGSSLVRSSGIYTIASFINASIPFLLLPVLTAHLTKTDFGIITMFTTVVGFVVPFIGINMEGAIGRKYFIAETNISQYIGNCFVIFALSSSINIIFFIFFKSVISKYTEIPSNWLIFVPLFCIFQFVSLVRLTLWQVSVKPIKYGFFQIIQSILNFGLSILFVVLIGMNWQGRVISMLIATVIAALFAFYSLVKEYSFNLSLNREYIIHALKYGGGLIPHVLGGTLIIMTSRLFLTNMVNIEQTGVYGVAQMVTSIIGFFTISFNNAFAPWLFSKLSKDDLSEKRKIVKITYLYFTLIIIFGFLFYLFLPIVFKLFVNKSFNDALPFCSLLIVGYIFQGMYFMVTNYISFVEKTHIQALITISVGLLNIPINYFLIKHFGAIGAAMAFGIIFVVFFIVTWILSAKLFSMPWMYSLKIKMK